MPLSCHCFVSELDDLSPPGVPYIIEALLALPKRYAVAVDPSILGLVLRLLCEWKAWGPEEKGV